MKTLEDLYKEVMASDELKKAFAQAAKDKKVADFLKAQGCDATEEEFKAFLVEKAKNDKALSEEDLENVAGGGLKNPFENLNSIIGCHPVSWNGCILTTEGVKCHD